MKIVNIANQKVRIREVSMPGILSPDDVLVHIRYATLSPDDLGLFLSGNMITGNPYNYGQAGSGIVEQLGPMAYHRGLEVGDRVVWFYRANCGVCYQCNTGDPLYCPNMTFCNTSFAEYMSWKEAYIYKLPEAVSLEEAVFFQDTLDCIRVFSEAAIGPNDSIAILGVNHKSLLMARYARLCGVRHITLICQHPHLLELAAGSGAHHYLRFGIDDLIQFSSSINREKGGFSVVIDCCGSLPMLQDAVYALAYGGVIAIPFSYPKGTILPIDLSNFYFKEPRIFVMKQSAKDAPKALELMPRLGLKDLTKDILPFAEVETLFTSEFYSSHLCGIVKLP